MQDEYDAVERVQSALTDIGLDTSRSLRRCGRPGGACSTYGHPDRPPATTGYLRVTISANTTWPTAQLCALEAHAT
jgi:hypothetical protein